jgi:hypothetical protein
MASDRGGLQGDFGRRRVEGEEEAAEGWGRRCSMSLGWGGGGGNCVGNGESGQAACEEGRGETGRCLMSFTSTFNQGRYRLV